MFFDPAKLKKKETPLATFATLATFEQKKEANAQKSQKSQKSQPLTDEKANSATDSKNYLNAQKSQKSQKSQPLTDEKAKDKLKAIAANLGHDADDLIDWYADDLADIADMPAADLIKLVGDYTAHRSKYRRSKPVAADTEGNHPMALYEAFISHLMGDGLRTNCCWAPAQKYCETGRRLRAAYLEATHG